jgi:hypothetical protein
MKAVETRCPDCGLFVGHLGDCLIGGHQAMEIKRLKDQLIKAEKIINIIDFDTQYVPTPFSKVMVWHGLINDYRNNYYPNLADDSNNCLACMGATGFSVQHTCKPK